MPLLYSYIRWSSDRQATGTTLERQMASAKEFALLNGLELVEIIDPGVSAFRGKNTKSGKLGDFIDAVKERIIPDDSWLYVENLDRLTRQDVTTAQKLFIELLDLGLTLVTGMDKRVYTLESVNQNPTDLMISILMFSRANEESKTKQARTVGNVETLVERHKQGLPVNIKSCGKHPFWIDDTGSQYEAVRQHPEYWKVAREAIDQFLQGHGIYKVKRYLDEKYPNGLNGKEWDYQVLKRLRENRALIGERTIK
ncbi:recombinase family protein, partial [Pectobacterium aroidearum]|uniref:recombinase family protein n=1 Tax=Pectobacterium aroidearum TaxID=1201031 RepID=UPI00301B5146